MKKSSTTTSLAQVKKSLSVLRRKGLYKPSVKRGAPTRYAKSLLKKYSDVVSGEATVVTAPTVREASAQRGAFRTSRKKIVVRKSEFSERARYSRKAGGVVQYMGVPGARYYLRPANVSHIGEVPPLVEDQFYALPFRHGTKISFTFASSVEEIARLVLEYETDVTKNVYKDMLSYLQIGTKVRHKGK